ncbi:MAG: radical SAM-associated putative lipoprotein [Alistipes sp.]|nr:radical SAM-associated putative lipoprotein [Alistipes sp.]
MKKLLYMLLALLGISATGCMRVEYGTPHVHFNLKARVVDEAGKPIEGIEARVKVDWGDHYTPFDNRTGVTNYLGEIDAHTGNMHSMDHTIIFIDPDGEANGGKFESKTVDISDHIVQTDEGDGNWDNGSYVAEIGDVVMTLEPESTEEENTNTEEE